jgi:ribosome biogenesis GTPase
MAGRRKKPRENNLAERYRAGDFDSQEMYEDDEEKKQTFSNRNKHAEQDKIEKTAALRAALEAAEAEVDPAGIDQLPVGQVLQVYSLFCDVESAGQSILCVTRKTLTKLTDTQIVVGDRVHFRDIGITHETGRREAVIERVLPRTTVLTRSNSFRSSIQHPIVANAQQMLIVASVKLPTVKWGLVDRMIVAAQSGGLRPIIVLNKVDLGLTGPVEQTKGDDDDESIDPNSALAHYASLGVQTLQTSVERDIGLDELRAVLKDQVTVLSGHSGVGKSSLIQKIQPKLKLRIGEISGYTGKGRHTTTSARHYPLDFGGSVIDTPGVKMFGLWKITRDNLMDYFPDIEAGTAPKWREQSARRIAASLTAES